MCIRFPLFFVVCRESEGLVTGETYKYYEKLMLSHSVAPALRIGPWSNDP